MSKIKVVGSATTYDFDEIKDSVIFLGGRYFFKHDDQNLVKVKTPGGKYKLYRKESPLIVRTINGTYAKKSDCIKTSDDLYFEKVHPDTIRLENGEYTHKKWCVFSNGKWYLKTDPELVNTRTGGWVLKKDCVKLSKTIYGDDFYDVFNPEVHVKIKNEIFYLEDTREIISWSGSGIVSTLYSKHDLPKVKLQSGVFKGFKDGSNPQIGRYETAYADATNVVRTDDGNNHVYVLSEQLSWFNGKINEIRESESLRVTEAAKKKCNNNFGDADPTENTAKSIDKGYQTWPGKQRLFGGIGEPILSKTIKGTGGLGYSFGVEIETSAGVVPSKLADGMRFIAVGDRSIGAAEYVSPVLHGDMGLRYLKDMADICAAHTLVDNRCSIHVHVGPSPGSGINHWGLDFDWRFAIASIKLGTLIEEELYQMLPEARNPYNRHCHSIQRFKDINEENWREYLGSFVFGPHEDWKHTMDFRNYKYGDSSYSKSHGLSTWCGGRYKWLNLVRCYSRCDSPTIEVRIWSPSTNYDKIYCYVLLSLAFTHVAASHYKKIMAGEVDLHEMVRLAFPKRKDIQELLENFIESRKKKFNRKEIYKTIPISAIKTITSTVNKVSEKPKKENNFIIATGLDPWD